MSGRALAAGSLRNVFPMFFIATSTTLSQCKKPKSRAADFENILALAEFPFNDKPEGDFVLLRQKLSPSGLSLNCQIDAIAKKMETEFSFLA